jgi:hypothetical protein
VGCELIVVVYYCLRKEWYGREGYDHHNLWLVLLKLDKDRFLGVDPQGQHVPPRVWYCSIIRIASEDVPCSVVRRRVHGVLKNRRVREEPLWENLSIARWVSMGKA